MIDLYAWGTPNGKKIPIFLEEAGVPYVLHKVDIGKEEQRSPEFLAKNPNGKIPVLVDSDGPVTIFESGAILVYLAEKFEKFIPKSPQGRAAAMAWLMFQMSAVGPLMGQLGYFRRHKGDPAEAKLGVARFDGEVRRVFGVLDGQLAKNDYLAGEYSIADMATYPWIAGYGFFNYDVAEWPHLKAWLERVGARPAVKKALAAF